MPKLVAVADAKARGSGGGDEVHAVAAPFEVGGVGRLELRDLLLALAVPDFHVAAKVPEASQDQQVALCQASQGENTWVVSRAMKSDRGTKQPWHQLQSSSANFYWQRM